MIGYVVAFLVAFLVGWIFSWQANVWAYRRRLKRDGTTTIASLFESVKVRACDRD